MQTQTSNVKEDVSASRWLGQNALASIINFFWHFLLFLAFLFYRSMWLARKSIKYGWVLLKWMMKHYVITWFLLVIYFYLNESFIYQSVSDLSNEDWTPFGKAVQFCARDYHVQSEKCKGIAFTRWYSLKNFMLYILQQTGTAE